MVEFSEGVNSARRYYAENRFDTLPILPGTKKCIVPDWQKISSDEAWLHAPSDSNIGIRCGGKRRFAVIDCDEKDQVGTYENIKNYLKGLGYDEYRFPVIQTASGIGRQIYCTLTESIPGNFKFLSSQFGCGEFRFGNGAFVVAPPSIVDYASEYQWLQGDLSYLPEIEFSVISGILRVSTSKDRHDDSKKILKNPNLTRNQKYMLNGTGIKKFKSRSEFEYALMVSLINTGWDWNGILYLFNKFPCGGKYYEINSEDSNRAYHYLRLSYNNACQWAETNISEGRQRALDAEAWALSRSWPGRGGSSDRDVLLAHVQIAKESGQVIYHADCRTLAEFANTEFRTVARANRRLVTAGLLNLEIPAVGNCAAQYSLSNSVTLPHSLIVRKCDTISKEHDVFAYRALGKSSKLIWEALETGPKTVNELFLITGKTPKTIRKRLLEMSKLVDGLSEDNKTMLHEVDGQWFRNSEINLDRIAELYGVKGIMENRKKRNQKERDMHNRVFQKAKQERN